MVDNLYLFIRVRVCADPFKYACGLQLRRLSETGVIFTFKIDKLRVIDRATASPTRLEFKRFVTSRDIPQTLTHQKQSNRKAVITIAKVEQQLARKNQRLSLTDVM
jgi:hypothetical protein